MADHAIVRDGVVVNLIVLPDDVEQSWLEHYLHGLGADRAVDVDTLTERPAIGWVFVRGVGYVAPQTLTVDPADDEIPPDGKTAATVTYTDRRPVAPETVEFVVAGVACTVELRHGVASIPVVSSTPGELVTVDVESLSTAVRVAGSPSG